MSCMSCHRPSLQLRLGRPVARPLAFVPHRHLVAVRAVRDADIVDPRGPYKFPAWVTDAILEVQEPAALEMAQRLRRAPVEVPGVGTILTACAGPEPEAAVGGPTIVMLHGFDSSCLEFRRFLPLLDGKARAWAVDLVGWGFTDNLHGGGKSVAITPETKRSHLRAFQDQVLGEEKMVLVGASLGGAAAIDFAFHHPERVERLVLVDAQGFIDGIGPMASMPDWAARAGIQVLRSWPLRAMANNMSYHNPALATSDAVAVGRVHTYADGWADANLSWMRSGGYAVSALVPQLTMPVMVVWGREDRVLEPSNAEKFRAALPAARVEVVAECGHVPHLEQPGRLRDLVMDFAANVAETTVNA